MSNQAKEDNMPEKLIARTYYLSQAEIEVIEKVARETHNSAKREDGISINQAMRNIIQDHK